MPDHRTLLYDHRPAELEVILPEPEHSFRWYEHDYPYSLARWNHHPEFEIHLIRQGSGRLLVGDYMGPFGPGHVAMIGPDLPHDWIGDVAPGEYLAGRDVVLQFDGAVLLSLRRTLPELGICSDYSSGPDVAWLLAAAPRGVPRNCLKRSGRPGAWRDWRCFSNCSTRLAAPATARPLAWQALATRQPSMREARSAFRKPSTTCMPNSPATCACR